MERCRTRCHTKPCSEHKMPMLKLVCESDTSFGSGSDKRGSARLFGQQCIRTGMGVHPHSAFALGMQSCMTGQQKDH